MAAPVVPMQNPPLAPTTYRMVASIDFGSSGTGYSWGYMDNPKKVYNDQQWVHSAGGSIKTPSVLLLDKNANFMEFGAAAKVRYVEEEEVGEAQELLYFDRIKPSLYGELSKRPMLKAANGVEVPAVQVIAHILNFMKTTVLKRMADAGVVNHKEVQFVVTVPAIWTDASKQIMREAAEEAGLCKQADQMQFALEPEAASIAVRQAQSIDSQDAFATNTVYMMVDLGGLTVDVAVHRIVDDDGKVDEVIEPTGGNWGSNEINTNFLNAMRKWFPASVVKGDAVTHPSGSGLPLIDLFRLEHPLDFVEMTDHFEILKQHRKPESQQPGLVLIPSFDMFVKEKTGKTVKALLDQAGMSEGDCIKWDGTRLIMSHKVIMDFFNPVIKNIMNHLTALLERKELSECQTMMLVGGFAASAILRSRIDEAFAHRIKILVPPHPEHAVLTGATLFGLSKDRIRTRVMRQTLGFSWLVPYTEEHRKQGREKHSYVQKGVTVYRATEYKPLVFIGDRFKVKDVVKHTVYPCEDNQAGMNVNIYMTTERDTPQYVDHPSFGNPSKPSGKLFIPMLKQDGGLDRPVNIEMELGGTEFNVKLHDQTSNARQSLKMEFLVPAQVCASSAAAGSGSSIAVAI